MADTASYYETLLTSIDTQISSLVSTQQVDYSIGSFRVSASDKLKQLMELRDRVVKWYRELPAEAIVSIQDLVTEFGEDITEYVNEGN